MDIYDFIKAHEKQISVLIECGGHRGTDTVKLAELLPNSINYTIEANNKLFNNYLKNLPYKYKNVKTFNHGLSNCTGKKNFYLEPPNMGDGGASSFQGKATIHGAFRHLRNGELLTTIYCKTLKCFLEDNNIDNVDFMVRCRGT